MYLHLILFLLIFQGITLAQGAKSVAESPKPTTTVSFERQALRENDTTAVEVWLNAESEPEITSVALDISSPDFLEWFDASCSQKLAGKDIALEPAGSKSTFHKRLCLKSRSDITAGEYNILFVFKYQWNKDKESRTALTSSEKSLKVNLLGSDSLAGIPLALAGLIVPGFCFLLILRACKVVGTEGVDLMIHGVVVSLGFIGLAKLLRRVVAGWGWTGFAQKLHYLDASSNVSVDKLIWLAAFGAGLGGLVALAYYSYKGIKTRRMLAFEIKAGDDDSTVLYKLLRKDARYNHALPVLWLKDLFGSGNEDYRPMTVVRVKGRGEFCGTLGVKAGTSAKLIGSFKVVVNGQTDPKLINKLRKHKNKGWLLQVYNVAVKKGLAIAGQNETTKIEGSTTTATGELVSTWDDDVTGIDFREKGSAYQPLDVP
jgi:hypothetical protein